MSVNYGQGIHSSWKRRAGGHRTNRIDRGSTHRAFFSVLMSGFGFVALVVSLVILSGCSTYPNSEDRVALASQRTKIQEFLALTANGHLVGSPDVHIYFNTQGAQRKIEYIENGATKLGEDLRLPCVWLSSKTSIFLPCLDRISNSFVPHFSREAIGWFDLFLRDARRHYEEELKGVNVERLSYDATYSRAINIVAKYPGHSFASELNEAIPRAIRQNQRRAIDAMIGLKGYRLTDTLREGIALADSLGQKQTAKNIFDRLNEMGELSAEERFAYGLDLSMAGSRYSAILKVIQSGDNAQIKAAYNNARTPGERKTIEALLAQKVPAKILKVRFEASGMESAKSFGGIGSDAISQTFSGIFGYRVGTEAKTKIEYTIRIDPELLKAENTYRFEAKMSLVAKGEGGYQSNCMWPLPTVCDNKLSSKEYTERISGVLKRNTPETGITVISWTPKYERRTMGGLTEYFVTSEVDVRVSDLKLHPVLSE